MSVDKVFSSTYNRTMKIKQTRNTLSDTYLDAVRIRQIVFVKGQSVPLSLEIDENEAYCLHFVLYDDKDQAAATCRILPNKEHSEVILQRMAVLPAYQKQNLGRFLLEDVIQFCQKQGFKRMILHAQLTAKGFYDKLGFTYFGEEFEEAGIMHISMEKIL